MTEMETVQIQDSHLGDEKSWDVRQKLFEMLAEYLQPSSTTSPESAAQTINGLFPNHRSKGYIEIAGEGNSRNEAPEMSESSVLAKEPPPEAIGEGGLKKEGGNLVKEDKIEFTKERSETMEMDKMVKEPPETFLWELWRLFLELAEQQPRGSSSQEKLAELVKALSKIRTSTSLEIWGSNITLWETLPLLRPCVLEEINSIDHSCQETDPTSVRDRLRWENLNAFTARLTRDGTADFSLYAIWALRDALEAEPDYRAKAYHEQGPGLDFNVPVAANWISLAGAKLFASDDDFGIAGGGRRLWKGKKGFCKERWKLWKKRFQEVSQSAQPSQNTRDIAKRAIEDMEKFESLAEYIQVLALD